MAIRRWLNNNPATTATGAVTLFVIAVGILLYTSGVFRGARPTTSDQFYFYDMKAQKLFAAKSTLIPPITAPSGGQGVVAQVYACGDCSAGQFVGLLQKYSPAAKQAIEGGLPPNPAGDLVCMPEPGSEWVPADSPQGQTLRLAAVAAARAHCKGREPRRCFPP